MKIVLSRWSPNNTLLLNFVRSTVLSTRLCSDKKLISENEQEQEKKKKVTPAKRAKSKKILQNLLDAFPETTSKEAKKDAENNLNILKDAVIKQAEENSTNDSSKLSKIKSVSAVKSNKFSHRTRGKSHDILRQLNFSIDNVAKEFKGDEKNTKLELANKVKDLFDESKTEEKKPSLPTKEEEKPTKLSKLNLASTLMDYENVDKSRRRPNEWKGKTTEGLGIFGTDYRPSTENEVKLKIWDELKKEELAAMASAAPRNYFEELIMWTEQGKLWHFPIDNEQGLEKEKKVDFTEHVFLDEHLEPWCPKVGPLRHFMELVTCGLSKNPYLTVEDKKEHIYWFRDYFENKKKLLLSLGAYEKKSVS